jgi:hypothetical protein
MFVLFNIGKSWKQKSIWNNFEDTYFSFVDVATHDLAKQAIMTPSKYLLGKTVVDDKIRE